ncbi:unnamed protein product [Brassicogethes aeneus]|uniref:C2H2-type domain-containing protein n=1 Tax=Brassicogethes aeneus TaxID=1431903 RepID=A0A9P0BJE5_BRAAE|nr:unnamed protein product [Brassicogethes aeneus]
MEPIIVKKEPKEPVDGSVGDILMNYNKSRPTSADQEIPSTSEIAIKQESKEELNNYDNPMDDDELEVKKGLKTSRDEEVKVKFEGKEEMLLDKGLEESYCDYPDHVDESDLLTCNIKEEERDSDFEEDYHGVKFDEESRTDSDVVNKKLLAKKDVLGKLKCNNCAYVTIRKDHFRTHLNMHNRKKYLKCHFCEYKAATLQSLNAHVLSKHKSENKGENEIKITSKIHTCPKCAYSTVIKSHYDRHVKVCLKLKNVRWYKCHICNYKTILKSNLNSHIKNHNQIKQLKCLFCQYQSNRKSSVDNHILFKHSDLLNESNQNLITSKVHCCQHCNFKTTHASDLKRHLNHNH